MSQHPARTMISAVCSVNIRKSYQLFWQATPAAESLNGFWDECECAGNLGILELQKTYNDSNIWVKGKNGSVFSHWPAVRRAVACTYGMMGTQLEGVWRKNGNSKKAQENKAANSRVLNMWVTCGEGTYGKYGNCLQNTRKILEKKLTVHHNTFLIAVVPNLK